jgi:hypothetical protein
MERTIRTLTTSLLVACLGWGCNTLDEDPGADTAAIDHALSLSASSTFILTHLDLRRCASPICGGYFVKAVNLERLT